MSKIVIIAVLFSLLISCSKPPYPKAWFEPVNDPNKPDWEILPQEAKRGEVILSKRNELGILSNFAATPFELDGKRYASVEGFWQMMLYPETEPCPDCPIDPRLKEGVEWKYAREQVSQMTGFEAKQAGTLAEENMKKLGIDWCTYSVNGIDTFDIDGKGRFPYRSATPGTHYALIVAAMRAKLNQNPEVKSILLATGDLRLRPDHYGEPAPPPEWYYCDIWMQLRNELRPQSDTYSIF
ncbi:MAG: NADAR family protein [Chloracidobacterium sp.]|nr:NADAR family protein [Chloracidobacterium sp.]